MLELELRDVEIRTDSKYVFDGMVKHRHRWRTGFTGDLPNGGRVGYPRQARMGYQMRAGCFTFFPAMLLVWFATFPPLAGLT